MPGVVVTQSFPLISEEARDYIANHPLVREAWDRCTEISMTLDRIWRPDPDVEYCGEPRTPQELEEARALVPVREYLKDVERRLALRAQRRARLAYAEFVRKAHSAPERLAA